MPIDSDRIAQQLAQLEEYLDDLRTLEHKDQNEFTKRSDTEAIAERRVFKVIQAVLDIATTINAQLGLGVPKNDRDVFLHLREKGLLNEDLTQRFMAMVGLRNILTHEYTSLDPKRIYEVIHSDLDNIRAFVGAVSSYLTND